MRDWERRAVGAPSQKGSQVLRALLQRIHAHCMCRVLVARSSPPLSTWRTPGQLGVSLQRPCSCSTIDARHHPAVMQHLSRSNAGNHQAQSAPLPLSPATPFAQRANVLWAQQSRAWRQPWLSAVSEQLPAAAAAPPTRRAPAPSRNARHHTNSLTSCLPYCPLQALSAMIMMRCWRLLTPPTTAWLVTALGLAAADIAWRTRARTSYLRRACPR